MLYSHITKNTMLQKSVITIFFAIWNKTIAYLQVYGIAY